MPLTFNNFCYYNSSLRNETALFLLTTILCSEKGEKGYEKICISGSSRVNSLLFHHKLFSPFL
jgi:hypothetical protein